MDNNMVMEIAATVLVDHPFDNLFTLNDDCYKEKINCVAPILVLGFIGYRDSILPPQHMAK